MNIALVGYRGSGKSTIGRKLAERLWLSFVDTDEWIVKKAGQTIAQIFQEQGEKAFRDLETEALGQLCPLQEHVIALGGGALMRDQNRRLLQEAGHKVIYLRCEAAVLLQRIQGDPQTQANRPNLTSLGGGIEEIRRVLAEREPVYRQAMHAELDVTGLTVEEAVVRIVKLL